MRALPLVFASMLILAGCGDPLESVPRLSDVDVAKEAGRSEVVAPDPAETLAEETAPKVSEEAKPTGGFLGFLRSRADAAKEESTAPADAPASTAAATTADTETEAVLAAAPPPADDPPADDNASRPRRGLFGGLQKSAGAASSSDNTQASTPRTRRSKAPKPGAPDYRQVGPGVTLPYGEIARLCGVAAGRLGTKTAKYPERGRGYTLYDSAPGGTGVRNFYLTGFDDGCARQFSAALVLFGTPETYEQIRFGAPSKTQPIAETDRAYEQIKSRVCRVAKGKPCGSRMTQLSKDTVFVSVYERFGSNPRWKNLLLHDGAVAALDIKSK